MDKVRFDVVGTNLIDDWVITGTRQDERFELAAIYSRTQETADVFVSKRNMPCMFTFLEEVAKSPLIDTVYIASLSFLHASQSIFRTSYGEHVLCEKPFVSNTKGVRTVIEASHTYNVTLMEVMKPAPMPNLLVVRENLRCVGTVRRYFVCYCRYSSRYGKFKEEIVLNVFKPELSNRAMMGIGIYTVYPMVVLFGYPKKIDTPGIVLSSGADGQGAVNFLYEGMDAMVLYSKITNPTLPTGIQGEERNLTLDRINIIRKVTYSPRLVPVMGKGSEPVPEDLSVVVDRDECCCEVTEFVSLVLSGKWKSEINSLDNSLITLKIINEVCRQLGTVYPAD